MPRLSRTSTAIVLFPPAMKGSTLVVFTLLTIGAHASCSGHHRPPDAEPDTVADSIATLTVENHGTLDCDIFILHNGARDRVGTVTATHTESFSLPGRTFSYTAGVQLQAHAVGRRDTFTSERFTVHGGNTVVWTLETNLERSSLGVW